MTRGVCTITFVVIFWLQFRMIYDTSRQHRNLALVRRNFRAQRINWLILDTRNV